MNAESLYIIDSLDDVMKRDIFAVVQALQLVAHVLEQQPLLVRVALQPPLQQTQDELHLCRDKGMVCYVTDVQKSLR